MARYLDVLATAIESAQIKAACVYALDEEIGTINIKEFRWTYKAPAVSIDQFLTVAREYGFKVQADGDTIEIWPGDSGWQNPDRE